MSTASIIVRDRRRVGRPAADPSPDADGRRAAGATRAAAATQVAGGSRVAGAARVAGGSRAAAAVAQPRHELRPAGSAEPGARGRPPLEVMVPRPSRLLRRLVVGAGVLVAVGILFGLVLVHVELTATQLRLTHLQDRAGAAQTTNLKLRLQVSQLESPARIVATAQQLGMVPPPKITYLAGTPGSAQPTPDSPPLSQPAPAEGLSGWAMTKRVATTP